MSGNVSKSGDLRIETLRGIAIIAVVANHAGLWLSHALTQSGYDFALTSSVTTFFSDLLTPIRMPLFTVLSGFVYAIHPFSRDKGVLFVQGKFRRIIIPLFFVSTVMYFLTLVFTSETPGIVGRNPQIIPPHDFWVMWFYNFGHLWFLQVLIVLFAMISIIDALGLMNTSKKWLFWLAVSAMAYYFTPRSIEFWSLNRVINIQIFFFFGIGLYRFKEQIFTPVIVKFATYVFVATMLIHYYVKSQHIGNHFNYWPLVILAGTAGPIWILSLNFTWKPLIWIGKYSYSIYLYHGVPVLVLSPLLIGLLSSNSTHWVWVTFFVLISLLFPVIIENIGKKIPYFRTPLLGRRA